MLAIRFLRSGRKNRAFFRIVVTENSRPPKSNYLTELGWFDPHSKQSSLKTEEILKYLDNGAKPSNSVAKLLIDNKMKHKQIVFIPDAPKAKKGKKDEGENTAVEKKEVKAKDEAVAEESPAQEQAKTKEKKTEKPAEKVQDAAPEKTVDEAKEETEEKLVGKDKKEIKES